MKGLAALIRVHRFQVEERRKKLAGLQSLRHELQDKIAGLEQALVDEGAERGDSVEAARSYSGYLRAELDRRRRMEATIAELGGEIAAAEDEVAQAFRELKSYEITLERRSQERLLRRRRREQQLLDEIGATIHRRGGPALPG